MKTLLTFTSVIGLLVFAQGAFAQTFTYTVENLKTSITGFATGTDPSGAIVVPASLGGYPVTEIGRSAFKDRVNITGIGFASGASVTKIGATAFQGCTGLQSISLPAGTTTLPNGVLQGCTNLNAVTIPATVTVIGDMAFADCRSLATLALPGALTTLGESAFLNCRSLTSLAISSGVTAIPGQLCNECRTLGSISLPAGVTKIGYSAFANCAGLTSFALSTATTSIGNEAFLGCSGLTTVSINSSLATIGERAFEGCGSLSAINVDGSNTSFSSADGVLFDKTGSTLLLCPAGKSGNYPVPATVSIVAQGAFAHSELSTVTLPGSVSSLGQDTFYYASGLTSLAIPSSLSAIGPWAFAGCSGLTSVTIPATVANLGEDAFHSCSGLEWALFNGNAPAMGTTVFDNAAAGFTIYFHAAKTGFTSPLWMGYPASSLDAPAAFIGWLTQNGFAPGAVTSSDPDGDGVSLLMAYALGLDPKLNLAGSLPKPVLGEDSLSLTFQGNSEGIIYAAEASEDMQIWTSEGVTLSGPDANGMRSASIEFDPEAPLKFLRLVVED